MESMEYNTYFNQAPNAYSYLNFGNDSNILGHATSADGSGAIQSMETPLDTNSFMTSAFDYNFDNFVGPTDTGIPHSSSSASPPAQPISLLSSGSVDSGVALELDGDVIISQDRRSNSVDKDILTPAQSRRKAQNRAAQRAFRERKERHVRDLETKLNLLTTTTSSLQSDNERLKQMLQRTQTENEILKATASASSPTRHQHNLHRPPSFVDDPSTLPSSARSTKSVSSSSVSDEEPNLDRARLANGLLSTESSASSQTSPRSDTNLLSARETWDLLQSHPLCLQGALDIGEICERLKHLARCDGVGSVFSEDDVRRVIEEVGSRGNDELL